MVSIINQKVVSDGLIYADVFALSTDTLPTKGLATGSHAHIIDTNKEYYMDSAAQAWFEKGGETLPNVTISFDMQGHGTQVADVTTTWNTAATKPSNPSATGYTFGNWYLEPECETAWVWTDKVLNTMTLYAKWTPTEYTITYNLDGGTNSPNNPAKFTIESPDIVFEPATKEGYTFDGWYTSNAYTTEMTGIESGTHTNKNTYAKFTQDEA